MAAVAAAAWVSAAAVVVVVLPEDDSISLANRLAPRMMRSNMVTKCRLFSILLPNWLLESFKVLSFNRGPTICRTSSSSSGDNRFLVICFLSSNVTRTVTRCSHGCTWGASCKRPYIMVWNRSASSGMPHSRNFRSSGASKSMSAKGKVFVLTCSKNSLKGEL